MGESASRPALIAKIEKPAALEHLDGICAVSDGVIVARGDLGVELSFEMVPLWQKEILSRARAAGVFTITATQMLESMIENPTPTRAEVSDVSNAVLDGSDAVLLTAETAMGKFPVESVRVLSRILRQTDEAFHEESLGAPAGEEEPEEGIHPHLESVAGNHAADHHADVTSAVAAAAVEMAAGIKARWIVAFTISGRTVRLLARHRAPVPILALTPFEETRRKLALAWNTRALILPKARRVDAMMSRGVALIRAEKLARAGDTLVLMAGSVALPEGNNLLRIVRL